MELAMPTKRRLSTYKGVDYYRLPQRTFNEYSKYEIIGSNVFVRLDNEVDPATVKGIASMHVAPLLAYVLQDRKIAPPNMSSLLGITMGDLFKHIPLRRKATPEEIARLEDLRTALDKHIEKMRQSEKRRREARNRAYVKSAEATLKRLAPEKLAAAGNQQED
jgi:hypothetical protein